MDELLVSVTTSAALPNLKIPLKGRVCTLPAVSSLDCVPSLQTWDVGVFARLLAGAVSWFVSAESLTSLGLLVAVLHILAGLTIFRLTEL